MNNENINIETKTQEVEEVVLYYYFDNEGEKMCTSNLIFANSRAEYYGTENVYVEKKK